MLAVDANAVSQTATVTFDPTRTDVAELQGWVRECGYPLRRRVTAHPRLRSRIEPAGHPGGHGPGRPRAARRPRTTVPGHEGTTRRRAAPRVVISPHDAMGHGGHGGMSMDAMVAGHAQPVPGRGDPVHADPLFPRWAATCSASRCRRRSGCGTTCSPWCCPCR
ncbi:MAG: hypothetical protein IPL36_10660 [Nigerium sp.]|nr:hypothetical protein [Nigerium sp.]